MISASTDSTQGITLRRVIGGFTVAELRDATLDFVRSAPTPLALWEFTKADFNAVQAGALATEFDGVLPFAEIRGAGGPPSSSPLR